jgi:prepilin-type N-terminal cleavage/methylation domain-containing protein
MNMIKKQEKGFTLIELLIVIAIIGILASIVLVSLTSAREKANIAAYKAQASSLNAALMIECDTRALASGNIITLIGTSPNNKINVAAAVTISTGVSTTNCGSTGNGVYLVRIESIDLGNSAGATACETGDGTQLSQNGVTFPAGC